MVAAFSPSIPAVLVATLATMILGALWYSPLLFVKAWLKSIGKTEKDMKEGMSPAKAMTGMLLGALLSAYILAHFVAYTASVGALEGIQTGFWLWLGFVFPAHLGIKLFENRPWNWLLIASSYSAISLMLMGAIIASWK